MKSLKISEKNALKDRNRWKNQKVNSNSKDCKTIVQFIINIDGTNLHIFTFLSLNLFNNSSLIPPYYNWNLNFFPLVMTEA